MYTAKLIVKAYRSDTFVIKSGMWSLISTSLSRFIAAVKSGDDRYDVHLYVAVLRQLDKFRFGYSVEIATAAVLCYVQCVPHIKFNDVKQNKGKILPF